MFPNIELEMFKRKITVKQLAAICGICDSAMRNKLKGRQEFKFSEIMKILKQFEPMTWEYLFDRNNEQKAG